MQPHKYSFQSSVTIAAIWMDGPQKVSFYSLPNAECARTHFNILPGLPIFCDKYIEFNTQESKISNSIMFYAKHSILTSLTKYDQTKRYAHFQVSLKERKSDKLQ